MGDIQYLHILYLILIDGVSYGLPDLFFNGNASDWTVLCPLLTDSMKLGIFEFIPRRKHFVILGFVSTVMLTEGVGLWICDCSL